MRLVAVTAAAEVEAGVATAVPMVVREALRVAAVAGERQAVPMAMVEVPQPGLTAAQRVPRVPAAAAAKPVVIAVELMAVQPELQEMVVAVIQERATAV